MKKRLPRLAAALLLAVVCLPAQERTIIPWWNSPIVSDDIGLSQQQKDRIRKIVRSYRDRLLDGRNNIRKARADLDDIMNDNDVKPEAAKPVVDRLVAAQVIVTREYTNMSLQLRAVLTLDQWRALVKRWEEVKKSKLSDTQVSP
jgi:Spy/CpxP family protein refolding chaperone